jgi:hypothetical protein
MVLRLRFAGTFSGRHRNSRLLCVQLDPFRLGDFAQLYRFEFRSKSDGVGIVVIALEY